MINIVKKEKERNNQRLPKTHQKKTARPKAATYLPVEVGDIFGEAKELSEGLVARGGGGNLWLLFFEGGSG